MLSQVVSLVLQNLGVGVVVWAVYEAIGYPVDILKTVAVCAMINAIVSVAIAVWSDEEASR